MHPVCTWDCLEMGEEGNASGRDGTILGPAMPSPIIHEHYFMSAPRIRRQPPETKILSPAPQARRRRCETIASGTTAPPGSCRGMVGKSHTPHPSELYQVDRHPLSLDAPRSVRTHQAGMTALWPWSSRAECICPSAVPPGIPPIEIGHLETTEIPGEQRVIDVEICDVHDLIGEGHLLIIFLSERSS